MRNANQNPNPTMEATAKKHFYIQNLFDVFITNISIPNTISISIPNTMSISIPNTISIIYLLQYYH